MGYSFTMPLVNIFSKDNTMNIPRSQTNSADTWNLEPLYPDVATWKRDLDDEAAQDYDAATALYRNKKQLSASDVRALLDWYYATERRLKKLYTWAHLIHDQDTADDAGNQCLQRIVFRYHAFSEATAWLEPKILSQSARQITSYLASPCLTQYRTILERLVRLRPHTLPAEQESLIAMAGQALESPHKAFSAINDADFRFDDAIDSAGGKHPLTHGSYGVLLRDNDRMLRKSAFEHLHQTYERYENTLAELLHGEIQRHFFEAKARGYHSCLEAALFPKNIPVSVYHSLIAAVRDHVGELHRYVRLKKRALGLDEFHPWDLYVPLTPNVDAHYTFDQAVEHTLAACQPLGDSYGCALRKGLTTDRWVDRYENSHKRSGAYSSGCYDSFPYILMNFKGLLRDVFTLAHEAGHSMHTLLSTSQPYHYSEYAIFVAEVASTFTEELLSQRLFDAPGLSPQVRASLVNEKLEDFRATLFRQSMFAEFELYLHERVERGEPITPTVLREKFAELNRFYYGSDLIASPLLDIEWARIPHFYYNFYVYQYATGISAACTLVDRVTHGGPTEQREYLDFLRGGSHLFPIDLLKSAGVDMLTNTPVLHAIGRFSHMLDQMTKILAVDTTDC
jgi:oligoendopeptidase F